MNISSQLANQLRARGMTDLSDQLKAAGHVAANRGISLVGTTLLTSNASGDPAELPAGGQSLVNTYVPPAAIDYGSDLLATDALRAQASSAASNLRNYIALPSPTLAQSAVAIRLMARIQLYQINQLFPDL